MGTILDKCYEEDEDYGRDSSSTNRVIPEDLYNKLCQLGIIDNSGIRCHNVGQSNYSNGGTLIQPWTLWIDWKHLTPFDHDIIKRLFRAKQEAGMTFEESRKQDYAKIIHICEERIRQLDHK